jgi:acyl-coenzyme A thioesterase PaaI-like protein
MTDKAAEQLRTSGWTMVDTTGFLHLVGPLWQRVVDHEHEYALVAQDKHHNRRGLVQGGLLMTFADRSCGMTARYYRAGRHWRRSSSTPILSTAARSAIS